jgi:hypothetical protein
VEASILSKCIASDNAFSGTWPEILTASACTARVHANKKKYLETHEKRSNISYLPGFVQKKNTNIEPDQPIFFHVFLKKCIYITFIFKGASMSGRFHIYSICAILSLGSLSAADPSAKTPAQKKIKETTPLLFLQPCPDAFRFSADFLYFLPSVDDTYFAINSPIVGDFLLLGTRSNNDFSFHPGFRVGAEYAFCKSRRDLQAFYTYLHAEQKETISGENLWATVGSTAMATPFQHYLGTASSKLKLLYQRLDFNVSQHIIDSHGFNLYAQPGLEYTYLRLQQSYDFDITGALQGTVYQQSRGWGIGPQFGLGFDANLYNGSSRKTTHAIVVSGLFSSSILTGQARIHELDSNGSGTNDDLRDELTWRMIPALHARAGLAYVLHSSSVGFSLSAGYELDTYIRGLAKMIFPSTADTSNIMTNYYNFDVQGLDVSVAFTF